MKRLSKGRRRSRQLRAVILTLKGNPLYVIQLGNGMAGILSKSCPIAAHICRRFARIRFDRTSIVEDSLVIDKTRDYILSVWVIFSWINPKSRAPGHVSWSRDQKLLIR